MTHPTCTYPHCTCTRSTGGVTCEKVFEEAVCAPCGINYLAQQHKKICYAVATSNEGICPLCGVKAGLVPVRYYIENVNKA